MSAGGDSRVRLAFLGCGRAAQMHSGTLKKLRPKVECHFAARDPVRARALAARYPGGGVFETYEAAVGSDAIDAVFIVLPPKLHLEWTKRALEAKKHVIVEKPAYLTVAEFDEVAEAAEANGRRIFVAENYRYKPLLVVLRRALADGLVGEPLFIHVNAIKEQKTGDWRDDLHLAGGGALFEGGVHWVHFLGNLGPELVEVGGMRPGVGAGLDRSMLVTLRYAGGLVGTLSYSWEVPSPLKGLRISRVFGTDGTITFETNGLFVFVQGRRTRLVLPGFRDIAGYRAMLDDFVDAIRHDREPKMALLSARRDTERIESIYRSAHDGFGPNPIAE